MGIFNLYAAVVVWHNFHFVPRDERGKGVAQSPLLKALPILRRRRRKNKINDVINFLAVFQAVCCHPCNKEHFYLRRIIFFFPSLRTEENLLTLVPLTNVLLNKEGKKIKYPCSFIINIFKYFTDSKLLKINLQIVLI